MFLSLSKGVNGLLEAYDGLLTTQKQRLIFVIAAFFGVFAAGEDIDTPDFQCHILYEYDASTKGTVSSPFYGKRPVYDDGLWCECRIRALEGYFREPTGAVRAVFSRLLPPFRASVNAVRRIVMAEETGEHYFRDRICADLYRTVILQSAFL